MGLILTPSVELSHVPSLTHSKTPCPSSNLSCSSVRSRLLRAPIRRLALTLVTMSLAVCSTAFANQVACRPLRPSSTDVRTPTHPVRSSSMRLATLRRHPLPALNPPVATVTRGTTAALTSRTTSTTTTAGLCQPLVLSPNFLLVPLPRRLGM